MSPHRASRRIRFALAAIAVPFGLVAGSGCDGLVDEPGSPATVPPSTPAPVVIEGRPLRRRGRLVRARSRRGASRLTDRHALRLDPAVRAVLAEHWRDQGELEHASVVAFQDLAHRLAFVDAPDELLRRVLQAANQEADHAARCFELAGRYLGQSLRPGRLRRPRRLLPRSRVAELTRLAVESLRDGVLNEGYAAWVAGAKADRATDARVVETLRVIAVDEAGHAALSADVLAWCVREGGSEVRSAVRAAARDLPTRLVSSPVPVGFDQRLLAGHGFSNPDQHGHGYTEVLDRTRRMVGDDVAVAA